MFLGKTCQNKEVVSSGQGKSMFTSYPQHRWKMLITTDFKEFIKRFYLDLKAMVVIVCKKYKLDKFVDNCG